MSDPPGAVIARYALYLFATENVTSARITSKQIGASSSFNSTQVRRDIIKLGFGGKRGSGYARKELSAALRRELEAHRAAVEEVTAIAVERAAQLSQVRETL